jgi:hypothetical protein
MSLLYQQIQVIKCIKIGLLCQEHDPCKRPFIWDVIRDINEMESIYGQIRKPNESSVGQVSTDTLYIPGSRALLITPSGRFLFNIISSI